MRFVISKIIYLGHLEIFKMLCPPKKMCESSTRTGYNFIYFCFNHCQGVWYVVSEYCPTKVLYCQIYYIFSPALFSCWSSSIFRIGLGGVKELRKYFGGRGGSNQRAKHLRNSWTPPYLFRKKVTFYFSLNTFAVDKV